LLRSVPDPYQDVEALYQIPGLPPDLTRIPPGCSFTPRCPHAMDRCREEPALVTVGPTHTSACWLNIQEKNHV
ncbi:MAG: peptide ABC transporter ATP-binding protein, partial [Gemmatimonadaceae bacterium]|nr:peptide ABC transporter ATP-binding protein [Gloeobacterales cyanobacterium ES-bin-141]